MTRTRVNWQHVTAFLREAWLLLRNLRISYSEPDCTEEPTVHAIVLETIDVEPAYQRQGECRAFIDMLCADPRFDMVVVEAVQNKHLADALLRWGWDCDPGVSDFYLQRPCNIREVS